MLNFLGIGAQKAGTTWLYENLARHPQIGFPAGKEVHFWNQPGECTLAEYRNFFPDNGLCNGEITPAYAILDPDTITGIYAAFPRLRLIYLIRNPLQRAWSSALMALHRAEMTIDEASDQWFIDHFHSQGSLQRGDYAACITAWWRVFPEEQLLILRYEQLRTDPIGLLKRCCWHLGIDPAFYDTVPPDLLHKPVFAGSTPLIRPSLLPILQNLYISPLQTLARLLQEDFTHWYR